MGGECCLTIRSTGPVATGPVSSNVGLAEPRALIIRSRPPGGLEPPEPKVRRLAGGSPPTPIYDPCCLVRMGKQIPVSSRIGQANRGPGASLPRGEEPRRLKKRWKATECILLFPSNLMSRNNSDRRDHRIPSCSCSIDHAIVSFHPGQRAARAGIW